MRSKNSAGAGGKRQPRRRWRTLEAGDCVDIVAPASRCTPGDLDAGIKVLQAWGLQPRVPARVFGEVPFTSNTEAHRWRMLRGALEASDSAAVWCLRGGYGSAHLLDPLRRLQPPTIPKPVIGFSDITALLYSINRLWGWDVIHGPVVTQLGTGRVVQKDLRALRALLFNDTHDMTLRGLKARNPRAAALHDEGVEGRLQVGNLATFMSLCGGPQSPNFGGRIVVLEDVNERGYQIDRYLYTLLQSGAFKRARAVVFGEFLRGEEPDGSSQVSAAIAAFAARVNTPVFSGVPVGHGHRLPPLTIGAPASVRATGRGRFALNVRR